jgi:SNF2-related domain
MPGSRPGRRSRWPWAPQRARGFEFGGVRADGWIADLIRQLQSGGGFEALDPPPGFRGTLRPYQTRGYSWLGFLRRWGFGACLADDMGLGKTVQTLALIQHEWRSSEHRRPTLLICPMSVVGNWADGSGPLHAGLARARPPRSLAHQRARVQDTRGPSTP